MVREGHGFSRAAIGRNNEGFSLRDSPIRFRRQSGDTYSPVAFVANIQAHEQRRDLFKNAGILQFPAIDGADAGNLSGETSRKLQGVGVVAADDDVAIKSPISVQKISGQIVKGRDHADSLGHKFRGLLCA